jgi:hypothetical protein
MQREQPDWRHRESGELKQAGIGEVVSKGEFPFENPFATRVAPSLF